jgi:hypothetical protein
MKIKTEELRKYLTAAGQIKPNPTATNLDSIKIECTGQEVIFTKTNNNIWCTYSYVCQAQGLETILVNEKVLNGVALTSKEYEINISPYRDGGKTIKIVSGEDVIESQNQDIKLFPIIPTSAGERVKITKEAMERMRIAGKYVNTGSNVTALNFVNVGMNGIFASNYNVVYHHNDFPLPELLLDQEVLNTIKSTDDVLYWSSESYNFFQCDGFMYGFIKTAIAALNFSTIIDQSGVDSFVIRRDDMIDFCTLVHYSKRQENPLATLIGVSNKVLTLQYIDADFNINVTRNVAIEGNSVPEPFKFSTETMSLLMKTIPYDLLIFTKATQGHLIITVSEDPDYKGIIARLKDQ